MMCLKQSFAEIWFCDFEYWAPLGERPDVHCMVGRESKTGRVVKLFREQLSNSPPFSIGEDSLFVAYYAPAELGCFLQLGWPMPKRVLDLFAEFRCLTNGLPLTAGKSLLGALAHYGLDCMAADEKEEMRDLAIRGGPFTDSERLALVNYCADDVEALAGLFDAMSPQIDLPRALLRGRYMGAVARMEYNGTPIDVDILRRLRAAWSPIKGGLIDKVDSRYGIYDGQTFKRKRFAHWLELNEIPWPTLPTGVLALDRDTFREMAKSYPSVAPLHELRNTLGEMRLESLAVGADGRNRTMLSPFGGRTGRNQPGSAKFIFGPSCWLRGLIKPGPGRAVAYVDWSQQEFGIAAKLSGDVAMQQAYTSGDPYLTFAKQAGAVPERATKKSHAKERGLFKVCSLAVLYGMGATSLSTKLGRSRSHGRELLEMHNCAYPTFWKWSQAAVDYAMLRGRLWTVFGWTIHFGGEVNPRSLANFPVQANGAEMLRLACCLATERGVCVCAPIHDALLVEGPADDIADVVARTQAAMEEASREVLDGFGLRTDAEIVAWPNRYADPRGTVLWDAIQQILEHTPHSDPAHPAQGTLCTPHRVPSAPRTPRTVY